MIRMSGSDDDREFLSLLANDGVTCQITYVSDGKTPPNGSPAEFRQTQVMEEAAQEFLHRSGGDVCVLLAGRLQSSFSNDAYSTENAVADRCRLLLGEPGAKHYNAGKKIDLILDTLGGSLDSAFKTVLFLSRFTSNLRIFVPRRAKSAGTLIAIGSRNLYMTPFSELGPLDTQIRDPRNPTDTLSALDCYQSVDYVRKFGLNSLKRALVTLAREMETGISLPELLNTAAEFAGVSTKPMLDNVKALDFGGWGRTLQIGELYAKSLLQRAGYEEPETLSIATRLVYGYTHHPFPIDIDEARRIGLTVRLMKPSLAAPAHRMINQCADADLDIAVGAWKASRHYTVSRIIHRAASAEQPREVRMELPDANRTLTSIQKQAVADVLPVHYLPTGVSSRNSHSGLRRFFFFR